MTRGVFITLEGGEGAGKSTQVAMALAHLRTKGIPAIATREVGGAEGAEEIRKVWLSKPQGYWDPMTELMLIMAARREHLAKTVWPALEAGTWVISDRFVDSSRVYQGLVMGLGLEKVDGIYRHIAGDFWPQKTFILDLPASVGLARAAARKNTLDRYEQQALAFHEKLREGYLSLAAQESQRIEVIDAAQEPQAVAAALAASLDRLLAAVIPPSAN